MSDTCGIRFGPNRPCRRCRERRRRIRDLTASIWMPNSIPSLARNIHVLEAIAELSDSNLDPRFLWEPRDFSGEDIPTRGQRPATTAELR